MASSASEMAIFQRVVERGSFAGAAEDVGLSPSAVAKLITRLEIILHVRGGPALRRNRNDRSGSLATDEVEAA